MIVFWIVASLMVGAACMFVLPPLLRAGPTAVGGDPGPLNLSVARDHLRELQAEFAAGVIDGERHAEAVRELQERVHRESVSAGGSSASARHGVPGQRMVVVLGISLALASLGLYVLLGEPAAVSPADVPVPAADGQHGVTSAQIGARIEGLRARLDQHPEDGEGWAMLARSYGVLGRHQDALLAYQQAVKRIDTNAQLLVDYADTLALLRGRRLAGEPHELVKRALSIDPRNIKALALAGTAEFEAGNPGAAIDHWDRLLALLPADAQFARSIAGSIASARQLMVANAKGEPPPQGRVAITGSVGISAALATRVLPTDTVFVFARSVNGPRMPLAILRRTAADLPFDFRLDDGMAMAGGPRLSAAGVVLVGARISRSGSATPQSGDLEGALEPLSASSATSIRLVIDKVVP